MEKYKHLLTRHLSRIVLALLAVLMGLVYWFRQQEESSAIPPEPKPPLVSPDAVFTDDEIKNYEKLLLPKPRMEDSHLSVIRQFNMFDAQAIQRKDEEEKKARARFADADRAFNEGKLDLARSICEEIIYKIYPAHLEAKDLLQKIKEKEEAEASAKATPKPTPTPPPAATAQTPAPTAQSPAPTPQPSKPAARATLPPVE